LILYAFCEPEISELNVTILAYKDVFGFEVTVDNVEAMEVFERYCYLCSVEFGYGRREALPRG
jgi:hypothetical protein